MFYNITQQRHIIIIIIIIYVFPSSGEKVGREAPAHLGPDLNHWTT
jgi:hypothetical protein